MTQLRCKPGQLAMIIKSNAGNEGKIVRCIQLRAHSVFNYNPGHGPVWEIDTPLLTTLGSFVPACYDAWMMPLDDISDELQENNLQKVVDKQNTLSYNTNT